MEKPPKSNDSKEMCLFLLPTRETAIQLEEKAALLWGMKSNFPGSSKQLTPWGDLCLQQSISICGTEPWGQLPSGHPHKLRLENNQCAGSLLCHSARVPHFCKPLFEFRCPRWTHTFFMKLLICPPATLNWNQIHQLTLGCQVLFALGHKTLLFYGFFQVLPLKVYSSERFFEKQREAWINQITFSLTISLYIRN